MSMLRVNASVTSTDQQVITRAVESLSRAACGLALEGAEVYIIVGPDIDEDDEDDDK